MTSTAPVTNPTAAPAASDSKAKLSGDFSTFLTLLTTQLKNQDPTSPMDSNQFTQQLVEFSQVEQQIDTNTNLKSLIGQGTSQAGVFATAYLGKRVSVTNGNASLAAGAANWSYNLGGAAAATQLTITDSYGKVVYTGAGETGSGAHAFAWNGKDNAGNILPEGAYKLTATATGQDGANITTAVASAGTVNQIDMTGGSPQLVIGNMEVSLSEIAVVAN